MAGSVQASETTSQPGNSSKFDYRLMLEAFAEAVVVCDSTHRIVYLNPAAERLLGWQAAELVGQPVTTVIPDRLHSVHREGYKRYLATHKPRLIGRSVRVPALRKDGKEIEIELGLNAMIVGGEDLVIAALRDVGERVEQERQLTVTRYLRATTRAAAKLGTRLDFDHMLKIVVDALVADFDAALARVWLYDAATNSLQLRASAGLSKETSSSSYAHIDVATQPYKVGHVARSREPLISKNVVGDTQFDQDWVAREGIASSAVFPLLSGGELRGVLAHFSRKPLLDEVIEALTAFTAIVSASLNDVQLFVKQQGARVEAEDQRQKLQTILDMLPMGVLLVEGKEGLVTVVNPAGQEIWGTSYQSCTIDEFNQQFLVTAMDGAAYAPSEHPMMRALYRGERVREMVRHHRPDGQEGILEVMAAPFPGPIGGAVATFRDMTARLRMESELAERAGQLKALLEYLPVGVAYFDEQGVCRAANGPAGRILGRTRQEIAGVAASELFAHAPELLAAVDRCVLERAPHAEQSMPWADASYDEGVRFLDWRFEPLPATPPNMAGALALIVDVTERKRAADHLKIAKEAAEQTALNKTRFLSAVSHDLRTPVNALSLLAELLGHIVNQHDDSGGELRAVVGDIRLAAANLIELINDLLDLARFDSGDVAQHPTDFPLDAWLAATIEPLQLTAHAKNLSLS
ncbi:MAG TPA: PAS domain S-box protein, partial [Isosphaeraceae bacterium]|nr:PAS domain S-box protein [Isosphaeraceae bacterium]